MNVRRLAVALAFVLIMVGIVVVTLFVNNRSDDDLITTALDRLMTIKSFSGGLSVDTFIDPNHFVPDSGWGSLDLPLRISGPLEVAHNDDGQLVGKARLKFFFAGTSNEMLSAEVRLSGNDQNFLQFEGVPEEIKSLLNVSELEGTWFSVGGQEISALLPWPDPVVGSNDASTAAQMDQTSDWLSPTTRLSDTVIDGRPVLHYELSVNHGGLANFLSNLSQSFGVRPALDSGLDSVRSIIDGYDVVAEGYVDRQSGDFLLLKFGLFPNDDETSMPVAVTIKFDQFNQLVTVDRPAETQPLSTILLRLMSGSAVLSGGQQ
ncbi:hypothetical protein A2480_00205 [Candidatus Uhrbacteria bacterium RIFOXYC2_FULL_47_19]|uniref:Uncharacterized protein n=1 Tax=Candidatus Uhrbacteria bacterium RIFOXYC2_FULL_47_19 TaxID=1802424 RepID=A0A1F7WEC1_9BACT|nr:MAG: hypothetical protein A2480_00205 [Candidatus Uhrbacteria bacterium RIFOXYC2_FULL_47_19]HCC21789.1 hypothetical protein [Candidatus Uhrbacteria bacterium]